MSVKLRRTMKLRIANFGGLDEPLDPTLVPEVRAAQLLVLWVIRGRH